MTLNYYDNPFREKQVAPPPPKTTETTPAATAVRHEIEQVLGSDLFGMAELLRIEEIAKAGRLLLQATMPKTLGAAVKPGSGLLPFGSFPPNTSENFGATAVRELQAILPQMLGQRRSPTQLVRAIAAAKEEGLDDVATELREELRSLMNLQKRADPSVDTNCGCFHDGVGWVQPAGAPPCTKHGTAPAPDAPAPTEVASSL